MRRTRSAGVSAFDLKIGWLKFETRLNLLFFFLSLFFWPLTQTYHLWLVFIIFLITADIGIHQ